MNRKGQIFFYSPYIILVLGKKPGDYLQYRIACFDRISKKHWFSVLSEYVISQSELFKRLA